MFATNTLLPPILPLVFVVHCIMIHNFLGPLSIMISYYNEIGSSAVSNDKLQFFWRGQKWFLKLFVDIPYVLATFNLNTIFDCLTNWLLAAQKMLRTTVCLIVLCCSIQQYIYTYSHSSNLCVNLVTVLRKCRVCSLSAPTPPPLLCSNKIKI